MNVRNEIKAQIIRAGFTMQEVVDLLHDEYGLSLIHIQMCIRDRLGDLRLRSSIMLYGSSAWNTIYAVFQLWLGFYHHTFWSVSYTHLDVYKRQL